MAKRNKQGRRTDRRRGADADAIVGRGVHERGVRGVGYAHKFEMASEVRVDQLVLSELGLKRGEAAPYRIDAPRHVTSVPFMPLDAQALQYLQIARDLERDAFEQALRKHGYDPAIRNEYIDARVIAIHSIGGRAIVAEVDSVPISLSRQVVRRVFENAGVPIPELHAPHFKVGVADTASEQNNLKAAAEAVLVDAVVKVEPLDAYFSTYTQRVRPDYSPPSPTL